MTPMYKPESMNIELTTYCPLNCPQCYCTLTGGKNIDKDKALYWLKQAGEMGVQTVHLSGGETLCYPHLYELIRAASSYCKNVHVALSGWNFTSEVFEKLVSAGISGIFISLNGSTGEINAKTRDGFDHAISALSIMKEKEYSEIWVNWVMHSNNTDDFANVLKLAEDYNVKNLVIMALKPDSKHEMKTAPDAEQMVELAKLIRRYKGKVQIMVEACYSPMMALVFDNKWSGNTNIGIEKGCGAGLTSFSVNVDAKLSPCRHLDYFEDPQSLAEYWQQSSILRMIRMLEYVKMPPCNDCYYSPYCRHCVAINSKMNSSLYLGNEMCGLHNIQ